MEGVEAKRRNVVSEEELPMPLLAEEKPPVSLYLIADKNGNPCTAAIYEVKILRRGWRVFVADRKLNPLELIYKFVNEKRPVGFAACGALNSDIYFIGLEGSSGRRPLVSAPPCAFNMVTKKTRSNINFPNAPKRFSLVIGVNNKIHVVDNPPLEHLKSSYTPFECMEPATGTWRSLSPAPFHSLSFSEKNFQYLLSGYALFRNYIIVSLANLMNSKDDAFFSYNISTGNWKIVDTKIGVRYHVFEEKAGVVDDVIYVYLHSSSMLAYSSVEEKDGDDSHDLFIGPPVELQVDGVKSPPEEWDGMTSQSIADIGDRMLCLVETGHCSTTIVFQYVCITIVLIDDPCCIKTLSSSVCTLNTEGLGRVTIPSCFALKPEEFASTEYTGCTHGKHIQLGMDEGYIEGITERMENTMEEHLPASAAHLG